MSAFAEVRANAIRAGRIDADTGRLTVAGMAFTDDIIAALKATAAIEGDRPAVKWNTSRKGRA